MLKRIFLFMVFFIWIIGWYSLASWNTYVSDTKVSFIWTLSKNVFLESEELNKVVLIYRSEYDISDFEVSSSCEVESQLLNKINDFYFFEVKYTGSKCTNPKLVLKYWDYIFSNTETKVEITSYKRLLGLMIDYNSDYLTNLKSIYQKELIKLSDFSKYEYEWKWVSMYYMYTAKKRMFDEQEFRLKVVDDILSGRNKKYKIPVVWNKLPTNRIKMPNSARPYRKSYTDGIHHWWDIDTSFWHEVVSMDDWIIIRVVNNFKFEDISKVKEWDDVSDEDKLKNLDILRGNQVWLKTMKWDVIFYSHLNTIESSIEDWMIVKAGTVLWTVWITGVPDKNYNDYHLHFAMHKNPYDENRAWTYNILDYMKWDWMFKWESYEYIIKNQGNLFDK